MLKKFADFAPNKKKFCFGFLFGGCYRFFHRFALIFCVSFITILIHVLSKQTESPVRL